jgi:hypothetical protein
MYAMLLLYMKWLGPSSLIPQEIRLRDLYSSKENTTKSHHINWNHTIHIIDNIDQN